MSVQKTNAQFYDLQSQAKRYMHQLQILQTPVALGHSAKSLS